MRYFDRDLSWLTFNYRVLLEARDKNVPLYERIKFLGIYSSNLDEFFEIRVAGLMQSIRYQRETTGPDGIQTRDCLKRISDFCHETVAKQYDILNNTLIPALADEGIRAHGWSTERALEVARQVLLENPRKIFARPERAS